MSSHRSSVEVSAGPERRRRWSAEQKREIVSESLQPGAVALAVARRHGISSGLLYTWRRRLRAEMLSATSFMPVAVVSDPAMSVRQGRCSPQESTGAIGVELSDGIRLRVERGADAATLRLVLGVLEDLARFGPVRRGRERPR